MSQGKSGHSVGAKLRQLPTGNTLMKFQPFVMKKKKNNFDREKWISTDESGAFRSLFFLCGLRVLNEVVDRFPVTAIFSFRRAGTYWESFSSPRLVFPKL